MKQKEVIIETPEKIRFTYDISEIGTRIAAYTLDLVIQIVSVVLTVLLLFSVFSMTNFSIIFGGDDLSNLAIAFMFIVVFFIQWVYFIFFETIMNGQTPGKKAMRIRVIKSNGDSLDFATIVLRNLMRSVDGFPLFHVLGGFVAMLEKKSRRVGDLVADTLVVNEIQFNLSEPDFFTKTDMIDAPSLGLSKRLTEEELYILRRFLNESSKLPPKKMEEVALNLATEIKQKLELDEIIEHPVYFIKRVYNEHKIYYEK